MARKTSGAPPAPSTPTQGISITQAMATAYAHWNAGQADQAEQLCQQVLQVWPEHGDALHLLGLLAHTHGNRALALDFLRRACATPRAPALFYSNLTEMCRQSGLLTEAEAAGRRAVALDSTLVAGWSNLGIVLQESGKLEESLACLQRVAGRDPNNPELHNNLGNSLKRLGRLDEAREHYRRALELKPSYSEAHSNLANLLNDLGDTVQAMQEARLAVEFNPRNTDAYINAAGIALSLGDAGEALRWLDNLAQFAPLHVGGLVARARALKDCDRLDEAMASARQAASLAPESGEAREVLAQLLGAAGQAEAALEAYDVAVTLPSPHPTDALVGKASLFMELGRFPEAMATLDQALAVNPRDARAWFNRAEIKTVAAGDSDLAEMEQLLGAGGTQNRNERIMLHFALGKGWREAGDAERAFAHLKQGNSLKRATFSYDSAATDDWMSAIIDHFTPDLLNGLAGLGDPSDAPVFIIGMPRSGTTLIEQILASHPSVHCAGELSTVQRMVERISGADLRPLGFPRLLESLLAQDLAPLGRHYLDQVTALAPQARRIVDKMPANFLYAGLIHLMLPNARIIECRRDPVDTCLSCYSRLFAGEQRFTYDLRELGLFYRSYERLMAHWHRLLPQDRLIEIRYEDVVDDLEGTVRRLIAFLGLDWSESCLEFHRTPRQIRTASLGQVRQPLYRTGVGRWKPYAAHLTELLDALGVAAP